jgi:agmatinase
MEFPFGDIESCMHEIRRVTAEVLRHGKFPIILGGEHSITPPIVAAMSAAYPGLSVLQIDAHADLRDSFMGTRWNHACAIRRSLEHAPCTQVAIRSLSTEEAEVLPELKTRIFWDWNMRDDPDWIGRVVESLGEPVYVTIDVDGIDPGVMPATGTPEPGGLAWYEILRLLRAVAGKRRIVGADVVELSPIPGYIAPNFLCAKLVYKLLTYRFAPSATARP